MTEEHGKCGEGKWIIRLQTTEKQECRNRAAAERSRMQYGDPAEMERHQTDLSHSAAQRATRIPGHSGAAVSALWKLFPFRSKHIQLAERKQKAFGKAAGNGGGG